MSGCRGRMLGFSCPRGGQSAAMRDWRGRGWRRIRMFNLGAGVGVVPESRWHTWS